MSERRWAAATASVRKVANLLCSIFNCFSLLFLIDRERHTHTQNQITFVVFFFFVIFQRDKNISQRNSGADSDRETHSNDSSNQRAKNNNKKQSEKKAKKKFFFWKLKKTSHFSLFAWGRWFIDLNKKKKKKKREDSSALPLYFFYFSQCASGVEPSQSSQVTLYYRVI